MMKDPLVCSITSHRGAKWAKHKQTIILNIAAAFRENNKGVANTNKKGFFRVKLLPLL